MLPVSCQWSLGAAPATTVLLPSAPNTLQGPVQGRQHATPHDLWKCFNTSGGALSNTVFWKYCLRLYEGQWASGELLQALWQVRVGSHGGQQSEDVAPGGEWARSATLLPTSHHILSDDPLVELCRTWEMFNLHQSCVFLGLHWNLWCICEGAGLCTWGGGAVVAPAYVEIHWHICRVGMGCYRLFFASFGCLFFKKRFHGIFSMKRLENLWNSVSTQKPASFLCMVSFWLHSDQHRAGGVPGGGFFAKC